MISKESYHIISDNKKAVTELNIEELKTAVLVHLYYEEQVDIYKIYLENIPFFIDIIIISPKDKILERFPSSRFQKVKKKNRGRDSSALLVAAKNIVDHYEYICFIHDKKEKRLTEKEYVDLWSKNLWSNMLQSPIYIYNILELFASDDKIGMLVPLPPHKREMGVWLHSSWGENYCHTKRLADELNIATNISDENPPFTYSTVFWARTKTLKKLYLKDWQYIDFPDEPMRDDGEINHAVERVLQYVVEDAGYKVGIALSSSYAASFIEQLHYEMNALWDQMETTLGIRNYKGLDNYNLRREKIKNFEKKGLDIYLYGGGKVGKECLKLCLSLDIVPKGIIVTKMENILDKKIDGIPIMSINNVRLEQNMGIIVSVGSKKQAEIVEELEKRNFYQYLLFE